MPRGLNRDNVRELSEDLAEHRALVLALPVLVELQLDQLLHLQWLARHWIAVKLLEVRNDVAAGRSKSRKLEFQVFGSGSVSSGVGKRAPAAAFHVTRRFSGWIFSLNRNGSRTLSSWGLNVKLSRVLQDDATNYGGPEWIAGTEQSRRLITTWCQLDLCVKAVSALKRLRSTWTLDHSRLDRGERVLNSCYILEAPGMARGSNTHQESRRRQNGNSFWHPCNSPPMIHSFLRCTGGWPLQLAEPRRLQLQSPYESLVELQ